VAIAGGLSILLGYRAKLGAWSLCSSWFQHLDAATQVLDGADPMMAQIQMILFMKTSPCSAPLADFSVRSRTVQPRRPAALALNGG